MQGKRFLKKVIKINPRDVELRGKGSYKDIFNPDSSYDELKIIPVGQLIEIYGSSDSDEEFGTVEATLDALRVKGSRYTMFGKREFDVEIRYHGGPLDESEPRKKHINSQIKKIREGIKYQLIGIK